MPLAHPNPSCMVWASTYFIIATISGILISCGPKIPGIQNEARLMELVEIRCPTGLKTVECKNAFSFFGLRPHWKEIALPTSQKPTKFVKHQIRLLLTSILKRVLSNLAVKTLLAALQIDLSHILINNVVDHTGRNLYIQIC